MNGELGLRSLRAGAVKGNAGEHSFYSVQVPEHPHIEEHKSDRKYNVYTDVVYRFEVLPEPVLARFFRYMYIAGGLGLVALIGLATIKFQNGLETASDAQVYSHINGAVALACFVTMFVCTICFIIRVVEVTQRGFSWSERRKKMTVLNAAQFIAHTVNTLLYLSPNMVFMKTEEFKAFKILVWAAFCRFSIWVFIFLVFVIRSRMFSPLVDSRNQSIGFEDAVVLDAPWMHHWPIFVFWAVLQGLLVGLGIKLHNTDPGVAGFVLLSEKSVKCSISSLVKFHAGVITGSLVTLQVIGVWSILQSYRRLQKKPYNLYRGTNVGLRYHFVYAGTVGDFVVISMFLLFWMNYDSCGTGNLTILGFLPAQLVMTALSVMNCIMVMPVKPGRTITLSLQPDNFEWLESRAQTNVDVAKDLGAENKFCFEMSVKLWYWCLGVYAFDPATQECHDPQYPLLKFHVAMDMFNFKHHEFIADKGSDTRTLIAWNDDTILVCFRGTYSATNVWSDLQFWRVVHPPKRGNYFMRSQPLVHRGFLACWEYSKLDEKVLAIVKGIVEGDNFDRSRLRVLVTGHSLGGALAVLASYALAVKLDIGKRITCYTYGAPRVGNHAFVRDYNTCVPNTWQVINDEDLVPAVPKFLLLFKHVGEKVIINGAGDLIVRPHAVEVTLYRVFTLFKRSILITHHLLLSYRASFVAICEAQYMPGKALRGGMEAMEILLDKREKLLSNGLDVNTNKLQDLHRLSNSSSTEEEC